MSAHDWTGHTFGTITAIRLSTVGRPGPRWLFRCEACGVERVHRLRFVRRGSKTCGCGRVASPAPAWPFPLVRGADSAAISPVWREHEAKRSAPKSPFDLVAAINRAHVSARRANEFRRAIKATTDLSESR